MSSQLLQTVVETPEFIKQAAHCMDKMLCKEFVDYIAANPLDGNLISNTGGARKIRWAGSCNKGKSGGVRIIYYYHSFKMPIFLFTVYGKSQRANLSQAECNALKLIINTMVNCYEENDDE